MNEVIHEIWSSGDRGDPWGNVMGMRFGISYVLFATSNSIPDEWEFSPGMGEISPEAIRLEDGYPDVWLLDELEAGTVTADELVHAGNVLARFGSILEAKGMDY
jgi:hypothetical protein